MPPGSHVRLHSETSLPPPATPQQMNTAWHHRWVVSRFHLGQLRIRYLKTNPISHVTTDQNLISAYKTTFCGFFSHLTETLAEFTPCILNRVISTFFVHSIFRSWIYMWRVFANIETMFTTHMCFNQFIDHFRNPVTLARAEDIHSWTAVGSGSWFPGRE